MLPKYACGPRRSQWHNPTQPTSYAPYYNTLPTARRLWNGQKDLKGTAFSILLKYPIKSRADFWRKSVSQLGPFCVLFPAGPTCPHGSTHILTLSLEKVHFFLVDYFQFCVILKISRHFSQENAEKS